MTTPRSLPRLTEKQFQARVVAYAKLRGWLVYFTWHSIHSPSGFPDLFLIKGNRAFALELKVGRNYPTVAQEQWLAALDAVDGITAFVVWPEDEDHLYRLLDGAVAADPPREEVQDD